MSVALRSTLADIDTRNESPDEQTRASEHDLFFRFHAVFTAWSSYADLQESPSSSRPNPHGEHWDPMAWKVAALCLLHLLEIGARLPKLTLHPSRVKDVHNSRQRLGFQNRYRLSNEYSTTGRHIFPMIRIRERRERLSKLLTTSAQQRLSQSTSNLVDRTWPLKPSFLFLATRRSWWCIAPIRASTIKNLNNN